MAGQFCRILTAGAALALLPAWVAAQQAGGTVAGRVIDRATQQPVPSTQVVIVGTTRGAVTGDDGRYRIGNVAAGTYQLRAQRIGYEAGTQSVTVAAGGTATADFIVGATVVKIDEVVVTATGERQRLRETGNAVATIQPQVEVLAATTNLSDVLTARSPGVYVQQSGGTTGGGSRVRIRGANSVSLSNEPLLIIDGVRAANDLGNRSANFGVGGQAPSRLNDINPDDIESVEILKGPAASALYGTAAANGVIQITTKRGKAGQTRWNAHVEGGTLRNVTDFPANYGRVGTLPNGTRTTSCTLDLQTRNLCTPKPDSVISFSPLAAVSPLITGNRRSAGLDVSGGGENATYYLSGDLEREQGVYEVNRLNKVNLRANVRGQLRDNLDVSVNTGYLHSILQLPQNDNNILGALSSGLLGKNVDCSPRTPCGSDTISRGYASGQIPQEIYAIRTFENIERFTTSANSNWQVARWLTANGTAGLDFLNRLNQETVPANRVLFGSLPEGSRSSDPFRIYNYTANGNLTGNFNLRPTLRSTTSLGVQFNKELVQGTSAFGAKLLGGTESLSGTAARFAVSERNTDNKTVGGYVQEQLAWNDRVFVTAALRTDNNSAFGQKFGFIQYPAASLSWVISEEPFFPAALKRGWLSSLRLRTAYGQSGQRPNFRDAITFYNPTTVTVAGSDLPGITIGGTGNPDLRPERSAENEFGAEASFFNQRLGAQVTYYTKKTTDALIAQPLPPSAGASATRFVNIGRVSNRGWEYQLNAGLLNTQLAKFDVTLTGSTNRNRLENLGKDIKGNPITPIIFGFSSSQRHQEKYPLGGYWFKPIKSFADANGDKLIGRTEVVLGDTAVFLGSPLPTREYTVTPSLQLFNWVRVTALFDHKGGFRLYNDTRVFRCTNLGQTCREAEDPSSPLSEQAAVIAHFLGSDAGYIEDATYTKLRELAVTLTVPRALARRLRTDALSLTIAGRNLKTWTNYTGLDPEVNANPTTNFNSADFLTQPPVRYWTARLNFTW